MIHREIKFGQENPGQMGSIMVLGSDRLIWEYFVTGIAILDLKTVPMGM